MADLAPEAVHRRLLDAAAPALGFAVDHTVTAARRDALAAKLAELLACPEDGDDLDLRVEGETRGEGFLEHRFVLTSEPGADVPCHLLVPDGAPRPVPVFVCLQGHTSGMHLSLGRPADGFDRDFALQAVRRGYAALAIELRGFGERRDRRPADAREERFEPDSVDPNVTCKHAAMVALLLGRTSLGEKVLDVRRAIDALASFPEIDAGRVYAVGNSGGGTLAWYAACVEPRIGGLILGSCFATYAGSIGSVDHCCDNYLPGALRWFDFPDLAALVAPRPLVAVMGRGDPLFPLRGVEAAYRRTREIYEAACAADRCRLVLADGGHRFRPAEAWAAFAGLTGS